MNKKRTENYRLADAVSLYTTGVPASASFLKSLSNNPRIKYVWIVGHQLHADSSKPMFICSGISTILALAMETTFFPSKTFTVSVKKERT